MRVVLDANIFISFVLTGGATISSIFHAWEEEAFTLLTSEDIVGEIEEVLRRFVLSGEISWFEKEALMWRLKEDSELVAVTSKVLASPDKKDNRYLACAKDGKADFLVTGDEKHLLPLGEFEGTKIVSPLEFADILRKEQ